MNIILTLLVGLVAGLMDSLPMIKMKMDKHSILSAFTFYFIMPFIIFNLNLPILWWMKGALISLLLALPIIILVVKTDKKAVLPMVINAVVIGTLISLAGQLL